MIVIDGIAEYFSLPTIEDALVEDNQVVTHTTARCLKF